MNTYGLDAHSFQMNVGLFAEGFAKEFQWKTDRERVLFQMTTQNVLRMTDRAEKYVADFCEETGYDRTQLNQLMSEMFYKWGEYVDRLKKI
ncbi:hypothetical protein OGV91_11865 [Citrobacter sp. Cf093]|uniref:hypothetical protein n=1 Tax=Citrobacter TaxID=544 RepID=UPI001F335BB0|nr:MULTISPECIES: hypothetical protein [Citrobacter]MDM3212702.1 hypothetical protein [Citrobacter sp. Cf093]